MCSNKSFFSTVLLSLFIFTFTFSQSEKKEMEIRKKMWESDDPDFKVTEVPEKWKNESAVVICQRQYYEYEKEVYLKLLYNKESFHKRIKIQDKAAVSEYSEISYNSYDDFIGIKIIKPSGKEIIIDMKEAVEMEKENAYGYKYKYKKIAIPSLEPGDILDYYVYNDDTQTLYYLMYKFQDVIYTLQGNYPIMKQNLEFKLKRRCFLNIKAYNGAPELKVKEDPKDEATIYYVTDENREKAVEKLWFYPYRSVPTIKFQVRYASEGLEGDLPFAGKPRIPKTSINEAEILKYVENSLPRYTDVYALTEIESHLKKYYKTEKDPEKIAEAAFNFYRFKFDNRGDKTFVTVMSKILKKRKIPHDIVICTFNSISTIDQIVLEDELYFIIRVNTPKPFFLCPFGKHSLYNEIENGVQGSDAYLISALDKVKKIQKLKIPVVPSADNTSFQKINISINGEDFNSIKAQVETTLKGENRTETQNNLLYFRDYSEDEHKMMKEKTYLETLKKEKARKEYMEKADREREETSKEREKFLKQDAENNFDATILSVKNFNLKQFGRWSQDPAMIYSVEIEMEGLLKRVGPNYIFEVGKLIGEQVELTEEDKKREHNIYMAYARSFSNQVTIQIPNGYTIEGMENLNIDKQNEAGGFVSKATLNDNQLVITTSKFYNHNFEKVEDWNKLVDFLEAAYSFTQQKILLKKL